MTGDEIQHPDASAPATLSDMKELLKTLVPMAETIKSHQETITILSKQITDLQYQLKEIERRLDINASIR